MSDTLGTYSFLPWLRLGIANNITAVDGDPAVKTRASIGVDLKITGQAVGDAPPLETTVSRDVALYGPGDIVGIDPKVIVKVEPRDWITNFEPNYLPSIEFYPEEFVWRYTPAAPDLGTHRLRPWLALVVMKDDEQKDAPTVTSRPLPAIDVTGQPEAIFPPADQLWAWAHVHVNRDLIQEDGVFQSTDMEALRPRLESLLRNQPDHAYSRLLCPRRLEPDTGYHAFLVPTFESGRLAGLGLDPAPDNQAFFATLSAWAEYDSRPASTLYPYYHRWYFKTATVGDFEYLVRLLEPRPPDSRLGRRDMDVQAPGSNLPPIDDPELAGVLRLGGALKVPDEALSTAEENEAQAYEDWDQPYPHGFQDALARLVNRADDYAQEGHPDPIVTPPIYGRWHALTERLLFETDDTEVPQDENWVHELNLDPRFRVPAGFGTRVIQNKQEEYMDAAWEQVGDILEANRRIRLAQLAKETASIWHRRHLGPTRALGDARTFTLMAPVQRRVIADGFNLRHTVQQSTVPRAALSAPIRRALRPRDHVATRLGFDSPRGAEQLIDRINRGDVSAAPPRVPPDDLPTVDEVAETLEPTALPSPWLDGLQRNPWLKWLALLVLLLIALLLLAWSVSAAGSVAVVAVAVFRWLRALEAKADAADAVLPDASSPEAIDELPQFPDFEIRDPELDGGPVPSDPRPGPGTDSPEAERFKVALVETFELIDASTPLGEPPDRQPIDLGKLTNATFEALDPQRTVPAFTLGAISLPFHLMAINGEVFREAMAYPEFDTPMYKPLLDLSDEHFLPNIDKIPPNTITLLETNQRFIEAYMVGLNHEFARELLWRAFPTDQRGSYFRQFWDPSSVIDRRGLDKDALREALRDIPPLHTWSRFSKLGDHDHREAEGDNEEEIVLVIRGELLKRYPTAVIYAQKARWQLDDEGQIDRDQERVLETEGAAETRLRTPLYEAKVDPDVTFLGFDLTAEEAKGGTGRRNSTEPGWFFVIKERPGEPRFGLDIERDGELEVWNDLAWPDVLDAGDRGFLQVRPSGPTLELNEPDLPEGQEKVEQWGEDKALRWHPDMSSAELAYILYQVPVLVAVHASEMLPK